MNRRGRGRAARPAAVPTWTSWRIRIVSAVATPFGLAVLGCLVLAGWAGWTGGMLDGPIAREVRTSSVYAAPGVELDRAAAEQVIGDRRLVVVLLEPGADLQTGCASVRRAAAGTLVLLLSAGDDGYDRWGCALVPTDTPAELGRAVAAEYGIQRGIDPFVDRPLEAIKVIAINYDLLAKAGSIPADARTISPPLPRYLVALAAVAAVIGGATAAYAAARRAGRFVARQLAAREDDSDRQSQLRAATAIVARQLIDLDRRYGQLPKRSRKRYRRLAARYVELLDAVSAADVQDDDALASLTERVEALGDRCRALLR